MRIFEFADFRYDEAERVLYKGDDGGCSPVSLAPKVSDTLYVLIKNHNRVVSKDALMREVWQDTFVEENNLTQYIFLLRRTLGENSDQKFIETVPRRGYRFIAEVRERTLENEKNSPVSFAEDQETNNFELTPQWQKTKGDEHKIKRPFLPQIFQSRLFLLSIGLMVIVFVSISFFPHRSDAGKSWSPEKIKIRKLTDFGKLFGAAISPDGNLMAYVSRDGKNDSLRLKNILTESEILLVQSEGVELNSPHFSPDGNYIYYGRTPLNGKNEIFQIPILGGESHKIAENSMSEFSVSPDGRQIAFPRLIPSENKHQIILANTDASGGEQVIAERTKPEFFHLWGPAPAWSSDSKKLIVVAGTSNKNDVELIEINIGNGSEREIKLRNSWFWIGNLMWENADELLVSAMENRKSSQQLWHVNLETGEAARITNDLNDYLSISLPKSANKILTLQETNNFHLWLFDAETGEARQLTFGESRRDGLGGVTFAPDGKILYAARETDETNIFEINPETGETRQLTRHAGRNFEPAVSPDNSTIVFVSDRTGTEKLWLMKRDGSSARPLITFSNNNQISELTPSFSADGRWIYFLTYSSPIANIFKVSADGGGEPIRITTETRGRVLPSLSPDEKFLSFGENVNDNADKIAVLSLNNAAGEEKFFDFPAFRMFSRWLPDLSSLATINCGKDGNNLVSHNIFTGAEKQITNFSNERIERFDISRDGKKFVLTRGNATMDAVLLER